MVRYFTSIFRGIPSLLTPAPMRRGESYEISNLRSDLIAGITVGIILIPQAMALALIAGLPAVYGLYAALPGFVASLWGSSQHLSTGPVALIAFLTYTALLPIAEPGTDEFITLAAILALLVGVIQLLVGLFRFGFIMQFIPHSAIVGFTSAAATIILVGQLPVLFGIAPGNHELLYQNVISFFQSVQYLSPVTFAVGFVAIALLVAFRRLPRTFPGTLIVLVLGAAATIFFDLASQGVELVQQIPGTLPIPSFPPVSIEKIILLIPHAGVIAFIGFVEAHAISKGVASVTKQRLDTNQELVGQGLANIVAGFFRGFPISGSFLRTAVNVEAGARTRYASLVTALVTVITLLFLAPALSFLPRAVLAAIVISSTAGMIAIGKMRRMYAAFPGDGIVALSTFGMAFLMKADQALFIGVFIALMLFLRQTVWGIKVHEMAIDTDFNILRAANNATNKHPLPGVVIVRPGVPMYFANTEHMIEEMNLIIKIRSHEAPVERVVIDFSAVHFIDITGVEALQDFMLDMHDREIEVASIYIRKPVAETLNNVPDFPPLTTLHNIAELKKWCDEN